MSVLAARIAAIADVARGGDWYGHGKGRTRDGGSV